MSQSNSDYPKWLSTDRKTNDKMEYLTSKYDEDIHLMRNPFFHDYGSILHLALFRRLSHKTQVFTFPEDNLRNRMIHSFEVAHVAKQLLLIFFRKCVQNGITVSPDIERKSEDCLNAICLAHDIGHPPFAHTGEKTLLNVFNNLDGSFDSNIQNIRILTNLNPIGSNYKLNITAAVLDGTLKEKPSGIFKHEGDDKFSQEEKEYVDLISSTTGTKLSNEYASKLAEIHGWINESNFVRHPLTYFMVAADDISYITSDIEDALKMGYVDIYRLLEIINISKIKGADQEYREINNSNDWDKKLRECDERNNYGPIKSAILRGLVFYVSTILDSVIKDYKSESNFIMNLPFIFAKASLEYRAPTLELGNFLYMDTDVKLKRQQTGLYAQKINDFKRLLYKETILKSKRVLEDNEKGKQIIQGIFERIVPERDDINFKDKCTKVLPYLKSKEFMSLIDKKLEEPETKESRDDVRRILVDYIASMSDRYAENYYNELKESLVINSIIDSSDIRKRSGNG